MKIGCDSFDAQRFEAKICRSGGVIVAGLICVRVENDAHGDIDVFEDLAGSDAENAIAGFD